MKESVLKQENSAQTEVSARFRTLVFTELLTAFLIGGVVAFSTRGTDATLGISNSDVATFLGVMAAIFGSVIAIVVAVAFSSATRPDPSSEVSLVFASRWLIGIANVLAFFAGLCGAFLVVALIAELTKATAEEVLVLFFSLCIALGLAIVTNMAAASIWADYSSETAKHRQNALNKNAMARQDHIAKKLRNEPPKTGSFWREVERFFAGVWRKVRFTFRNCCDLFFNADTFWRHGPGIVVMGSVVVWSFVGAMELRIALVIFVVLLLFYLSYCYDTATTWERVLRDKTVDNLTTDRRVKRLAQRSRWIVVAGILPLALSFGFWFVSRFFGKGGGTQDTVTVIAVGFFGLGFFLLHLCVALLYWSFQFHTQTAVYSWFEVSWV